MTKKSIHISILALMTVVFWAVLSPGPIHAHAAPESDVFCITFNTPAGDFIYTDMPVDPTDYLVADEINSRNINSPLTVKRAMMSRAVRSGATFERAVTLCMPLVSRMADNMETALYVAPKNAEMTFDPSAARPFTVRRDKPGRKLDREKTFELIYIAVQRGDQAALSAPILAIEPETTAAELIAGTYTRSSFTTNYSEDNEDRSHNIALALEKINGFILNPNEEFSFNDTVGRRTEANGFRQAKIIMDGDYVLGYGGGVCQASTTLYNAALLAGMEITMVKNHSLASSYVAPSLDAMVNASSSDLRFKNPLGRPVYIAASAADGTAYVRIYGLKPEYEIVAKSVVISHIPPPASETVIDTEHKYLPEEAQSGDSIEVRYPKEGIKSEAYLEYYKDGRLVRREKIRSDYYRALSGITAVAP